MKFVTIEINGITQSVPEADVAQYLRAGYRRVENKPAPVTPVDPDPAPVDPEPLEPAEPAEKPARKFK